MNKEIKMNIDIKNHKIIELNNYQDLSHKESFEFEFDKKKYNITFYRFMPKQVPYNEETCYKNVFSTHFEKLKKFIKNGDTVIDIGAHDGDTSIIYGFLVGQNGCVHAVEPSPIFQTGLLLNIFINNFNIKPYYYAVMEKDGLYDFLYDPTCENGGSDLLTSRIGNYTRKRLVVGKTFDNIFRDVNFDKINFIKTDTEGHDLHILFSIGDIINKYRPILQIEWFPSTENLIYNFCNTFNYTPFYWSSLKEVNFSNLNWEQDLILVPNEKKYEYN